MVVYLFLQGWRATLIPLLAVPVSLVGTFVFFPLFGFSINTLSLFGLVLAIGLVVDDAIVVVEGVERHIEEGLSPKDAALKAMEEISGPVVGIALVLSAVFVPTAFIPGITGRLYQQFAVTIAISVLLSAFNALTLSPALAALLLRPKKPSRGLLRRFFDWFNRVFERVNERLCTLEWGTPSARPSLWQSCLSRLAWLPGSSAIACRRAFFRMKTRASLCVRATPERGVTGANDRVVARRRENHHEYAGSSILNGFVGFSLLSFVRTSYNATFFVTFKPWDERTTRAEQFQAIKAHLNREFSRVPQALSSAFLRLPFPVSAPPADSRSSSKIVPATICSSWPRT